MLSCGQHVLISPSVSVVRVLRRAVVRCFVYRHVLGINSRVRWKGFTPGVSVMAGLINRRTNSRPRQLDFNSESFRGFREPTYDSSDEDSMMVSGEKLARPVESFDMQNVASALNEAAATPRVRRAYRNPMHANSGKLACCCCLVVMVGISSLITVGTRLPSFLAVLPGRHG